MRAATIDAAGVLGWLSAIYGVHEIYAPAAFFVFGLSCLAGSVLLSRGPR